LEDWWFDMTRSVQTCGNVKTFGDSKIVGEIRDSLTYIPVRPANARVALRELPINDHSRYTFIDMGSGKGRMLFWAAELSFRKVRGVVFVIDLHKQACDNIRRNNHRKQRCADIESTNANAADFKFPNENLVICLFNPFGPEVLSRMLTNLERSIKRYPRHVIILMIYPVFSDVVARMRGMRLYKQTRRHHIYQSGVGVGS
jgi:SAM-dependent methyltransferase